MMMDEMVYLNELAKRPKYEDDELHRLNFYLNDCEAENAKLEEELEAASRYIEENEVIHLKTKKDIPTVIEYQGRRYILDHSDTMKGGAKR
jgi:hypothetical protein